MLNITYTFLGDGPSDKCLLNLIRWILESKDLIYTEQFAEHSLPHRYGLRMRVEKALEFYPCDLLFIHRDAEKEPFDSRLNEIEEELKGIDIPFIPVIPVRMSEAWLLFDEVAIRKAAGNPNGSQDLNLPRIKNLENIPNPKEVLFEAIRQASGLTGRRLSKCQPERLRYRVAELIGTYQPLQLLRSFQHIEQQLQKFFDDQTQQ